MLEENMFKKFDNVLLTPEEAKEAILILQDSYRIQKLEHRLYLEDNYIPENIIALYIHYIEQNNYQAIVKNYKLQYIDNEALVESDVTIEERIGLAHVYDFISTYNFQKNPNIFVDALKIHCLLYSACPHPEFGGKLRVDSVRLQGSSYEVIPADEARKIFQSQITKTLNFDENNILNYIDEAIKTIIDLIKIQPFRDGNKRTFRALLNLLLGKIGIPPIYINIEEREIYKRELLKAIETNDYRAITKFYYYKICDAIIDLDLMKSLQKTENQETPFVIK